MQGTVAGTYLHGLFDSGTLTDALADRLMRKKGLDPGCVSSMSHRDYQEKQFDLLADMVREALNMDAVFAAMEAYRV